MITKIKGTVTYIFPDDINTDDIIPAWTLQESTDRKYFAKYAFANYDPSFIRKIEKNNSNILVAGKNFGCGSSREQAVYALQENHIVAVIAQSFPDIFFRNAVNNGLVLITIANPRLYKINTSIDIDLKNKTIKSGDKIFNFNMNEPDCQALIYGGKTGIATAHLEQILSGNSNRIDYQKTKIPSVKPQTIAEKIISAHLGKNVYAGEKVEKLPVDILFFNEVIGPPAIIDFREKFTRTFKKYGNKPKVFDKKKIFMIPDHTVPSSSVAVSEGITQMEIFAKEQGLKCFKEGDGIEHIVLIEEGKIVPGEIILGTDSHTDTNGALNTLAFGIGTTDGAYALATGYLYDFTVPETIRINLAGQFKKSVYAKDLILYLVGHLGVDGAVKQIIEFGGPGMRNISLDGRTTIANMVVEMGARTGIFEFDKVLKKYLDNSTALSYKPYSPDENCRYKKIINIDLSYLSPMVAFPHKPGNVTPVGNLKEYMNKSRRSKSADFVPVKTLTITDAFLGACTNGKYDDFVAAANVLRGHKVHPDVNFTVIPASRKIYNRLLKDGILQIFAASGANIESANCGPCFGKHMGVVGSCAQMISSSNRNYMGRMGSRNAKIFLASPATVTASAIEGKITDPRKYL